MNAKNLPILLFVILDRFISRHFDGPECETYNDMVISSTHMIDIVRICSLFVRHAIFKIDWSSICEEDELMEVKDKIREIKHFFQYVAAKSSTQAKYRSINVSDKMMKKVEDLTTDEEGNLSFKTFVNLYTEQVFNKKIKPFTYLEFYKALHTRLADDIENYAKENCIDIRVIFEKLYPMKIGLSYSGFGDYLITLPFFDELRVKQLITCHQYVDISESEDEKCDQIESATA